MENKFDVLSRYFFCFLAYSFIGWAYEVFLEVVVYRWGYSDRGVLFGPYCPVYGVGAIVFLLCIRPFMKKGRSLRFQIIQLIMVFFGCMILATGIELCTSYLLEAAIGSWPWQTYADYAINFQARIALSPSIRFGLGGLLFIYIIQPVLEKLMDIIPSKKRRLLICILLVLFVLDCIVTILTVL